MKNQSGLRWRANSGSIYFDPDPLLVMSREPTPLSQSAQIVDHRGNVVVELESQHPGTFKNPPGEVSIRFDDHGLVYVRTELNCRILLEDGMTINLVGGQELRMPKSFSTNMQVFTLTTPVATTLIDSGPTGGQPKKEPWFRKFDKPKKKGRK